MGLFDEVHCAYPLPGNPPGSDFQTKSFACSYMEEYRIAADGALWFHKKERVFEPDESKEGLATLMGALKTVSSEWQPLTDFRGEVRFYTSTQDGRWWEYSALFDAGKLLNLHCIHAGKQVYQP